MRGALIRSVPPVLVGRTLMTAGVIAGAPAILRGQNLNNKLNIAFIACGGRASASLGN
jgi:hypothetical protein